MPPSGFSEKAIQKAVGFLEECLTDLNNEVRQGKHFSLEEGVRFEIAQIERALTQKNGKGLKVEDGILHFVSAFYKDVLPQLVQGGDATANQATVSALESARNVMSKMHIDEKGRLVKRP